MLIVLTKKHNYNSWDFKHPTSKNPKWFTLPEWVEHKEKSLIYVKEKSIPQLEEILLEKCDPDIIWFDTPQWLPGELNEMIVNRGREVADPKVIFSSRSAWRLGDYLSTSDKPEEFRPVAYRWGIFQLQTFHIAQYTHRNRKQDISPHYSFDELLGLIACHRCIWD